MEKTFDLAKHLNVPKNIHTEFLEGFYILVDKTGVNWIVLDKDEHNLFGYLKKLSLKDSLLRFQLDRPELSDDEILSILVKVLKKVEIENFYENSLVHEQDPIEDIVKSIHLELTSDCNLNCKHCYMALSKVKTKEISYDRLISFLDIYIGNAKREIILSGGEPLKYSKIWSLLNYLKNKNQDVILFTNGLLINEENILKIKNNVSEVQISMEGISKKNFENIRGKNTYNKFLNTLKLLKENSVKTSLAITLLDENINDIEENLIDFLKSLNHSNLHIRLNDEIEFSGNAIHLENQNFKYDFKRKIRVNRIISSLKNNGYGFDTQESKGVKILNCGIGTSILLDYNENIYPCSMKTDLHYKLEEVLYSKNLNLEIEFNKLNDSWTVENMELCSNCELKFICSGECRLKNLESNGSWSIPLCDKNKKYSEMVIGYLGNLDKYE